MEIQSPTLSLSSCDSASHKRNSPRSSSSSQPHSRSRNGCWTCRTKKVKCDETRPQCRRCLRLKLLCDYKPRTKDSKVGWQMVRSQNRRLAPDKVDEGNEAAIDTTDLIATQSPLRQDEARSLSTFRMPVPATSSSSLVLSTIDHEAIRYFRTTFAKLHHTKNPDYSLYSIMLKIAEGNPIVMHMVLAVGGREMEFQRQFAIEYSHDHEEVSPSDHYCNALKLMADLIGNPLNQFNLDSTYTALFLMLLYEQKYGDEKCAGVNHHLNGAAMILKSLYNEKTGTLPPVPGTHRQLALSSDVYGSKQDYHLSLYAARIILWMAQFDATAASWGVGGQLNTLLKKLMSATSDETTLNYIQPLEKLEQLHRFSTPLYRTIWGKEYPQHELLDDIENRDIFFFEADCAQLRFMASRLAKLQNEGSESAETMAADLKRSIISVRNKFSEIIEVSAGLSSATDNSHRLVANIRRVVPQFHATVLYFTRLKARDEQSPAALQMEAIRQIMNLAFQTHKYDGEKAMPRIAWPLFTVALETNDDLHREWVLNRFSAMSKISDNFRRAHRFLVSIFDLQDKLGRRVDVVSKIQSGEFGSFVI